MISIMPRSSENTHSIPMRSDRFFAVNTSWFFTTREGADVGPFNTKEEAKHNLSTFIEFISIAPSGTLDLFLAKYLTLQ
jgi:hypothetical protein